MTLIEHFLTGSYTIRRRTPGYYKEGIYHGGPDEEIQVRGSMQPVNARELKIVSEGVRLKQYYKFYTDAPILAINTKTLANADVVEINGETFKVMSVENWLGTAFPYFKSIIYREPQQ